MNDRENKRDIHIENNKRWTVRDRQFTFAEIELGGQEGQQEEPVSRVVMPANLERNLDWQQDFRYVSREQQFVQKGRELERETVESAAFIPFQTYWPTYEQMQPGQLRWYLYWREEVRSGRYPDTDLSYLFVYLYELIHGIGWNVPAHGYALMDRVWQAYRQRYPKLDVYVREWLYDLALVFGLDMPLTEPLQKLPRNMSLELKELEWRRRFTAEPLELSWDMLLLLLDYDVEKSRFYMEQGRKELRAYIPKVLVLVDGYLAKTRGARLIERFKPREKRASRFLFRSAIYDHEMYGRTVTVPTLSISDDLPLRSYLTQLARLTENKLRELTGFKGKLRGISVEPEVEQLITRFLHKEFKQREAMVRIPEIKINSAKLRKLRQESDEVRDMLLIGDLPLVTGEGNDVRLPANFPDHTPQAKSYAQAQTKLGRSSYKPKPSNGLQQAELDFERGWQVFEEQDLTGHEQEVSMGLLKDDLLKQEQQEYNDITSELSDSMQVMLDTAGQHAEVFADDKGMDSQSEWREMFVRLSAGHMDMLSAMLEGKSATVRQGIAEQTGSMPELMLDEINELSMEWIGDLLIDGDEILEEYKAELQNMLKGR
ncbi:hypothetical protein EJP82_12120 [Paenibacillus anaericanus]|uniref:TerB N-terminal domain-containing protein n=1 Tax=Paenibacillus anaericanus TaxID=170367 RepID=A0A3S1BPP7_9BACL|nr:TerB N-terminal domain-containing protein [Paenibacillus anaericanus]RUT46588.1 hypothetical protein EJP82_12120 [Paenibacillus anaericanus]